MLKKTIPILLLVIMSACEVYRQDDYAEQYVIEAYLTAGETLPEVRLSRTIPLNQTFVFEEVAISDADIMIRLTAADGGSVEIYTYSESSRRGIYTPDNQEARVISARMYTLEVTGLDRPGDRITSSTIVPLQFDIVSLNVDETVYQSDVQFEFNLTRSFFPGRQNIFIASSTALDPDGFPLTPFWADRDGEPNEYIQVSSGLINEGNYTVNDDNTIDLKYPWIGIAYYGPNRLDIYAVDDNIFDYYRSLQTQQGGGGNISPGQIENVLWNVEGGIGLFGARAGVSAEVFVNRE